MIFKIIWILSTINVTKLKENSVFQKVILLWLNPFHWECWLNWIAIWTREYDSLRWLMRSIICVEQDFTSFVETDGGAVPIFELCWEWLGVHCDHNISLQVVGGFILSCRWNEYETHVVCTVFKCNSSSRCSMLMCIYVCMYVCEWVWCVLAPGTVSTFTCIFGFGVISFCLHLRLNRCSIAYARIPMRLTRMHNRRIVKSDFCSEFRPFWNFILV